VRLAWATDVHLNFLDPPELRAFVDSIAAAAPDAVLLTGDIAEAHSLEQYLTALASALELPIYFVLGNHDYYGSSIGGVRERVAALCRGHERLRWLNTSGVVALGRDTALVGHDGWADGRFGDWARSPIMLNDYVHIRDLTDPTTRLATMQRLAEECAQHFRALLPPALASFRRVIVATHVPPFRESCWYDGRISDDNWLPHFSSRAAGEAIVEAARAHCDRSLTVLCGHTHGQGAARPLANLEVLTGGADYGRPILQPLIEVV
jgi:predicted MPP superfamily phosphohydrolase